MMMHWMNEMVLEQPNLPFTFDMIGLTLDMLKSNVGEAAVNKLVGTEGLNGTDVVSLQVRQLLKYQVNMPASNLAEGRAAVDLNGQDTAKETLKRHLPAMLKTIKTKTKTKITDGAHVPIVEATEDL